MILVVWLYLRNGTSYSLWWTRARYVLIKFLSFSVSFARSWIVIWLGTKIPINSFRHILDCKLGFSSILRQGSLCNRQEKRKNQSRERIRGRLRFSNQRWIVGAKEKFEGDSNLTRYCSDGDCIDSGSASVIESFVRLYFPVTRRNLYRWYH